MHIQTFHRGPDRNLSYLFGPEDGSGPLAAIDPGPDITPILQAAKGRQIQYIVATHGHADHIEGLAALRERAGGVVLGHRALAPDFERRGIPLDVPLAGGDRFEVGEIPLRILYTPGHHPASICLLVAEQFLFTGDTLFVGNCGRTDIPGASAATLFASLQLIAELADDVIILPGHDYGSTPTSTIGRERRENAAFAAKTFEEFEAVP
jgi:glyoxylase-like metal-dependent hydrolase (beta-lactamase superfamily II)